VRKAVRDADPDAIVHQGTALADARFGRNFDRTFAQTNRLRTEGTDNLLAAAREAGVRRFVAQSYASMRNAREGGMVKSEDDPLDPTPVPSTPRSNAAMRHLDDEPAPVREWLPVLAEALGAKPPRHVPVWLARLIAGEFAVMMGTEARAASNAKAKRELGWTPRNSTWRTGFLIAYASSAPADEQASQPATARARTAA
jgi:nucleoside-diphosphate-sugar epimerase